MKYIGLTKLQTQQGTRYQVQCYSQAGSDRKSHYVGTYAGEQEAARAYDLAALVLKRGTPVLNFPRETYTDTDIQAMEEWLSRPRIQSSQFKGVRRMSARAGWDSLCSLEGIQIYLGCFQTEQDAAVQYDLAQLATHKLDAAACSDKLNFDWSDVPKEQINMMSTNVRLRISQRLGPDIVEQQLQEQTQHLGDEQQHQQQEPTCCAQQAEQWCAQETTQNALLEAKKQAKQQVQQARLAVKKYKQRLQGKPQMSNKKRNKLKAAKRAAKAALKESKQHLSLVKQQLAAADGEG